MFAILLVAVATVHVDTLTLSLIVGTVIPLVTAVLTKLKASDQVNSIVHVVLTVIAAGCTYLITNNGTARWQNLVIAAFAVYVSSGTTYSHLWKPLGVTTGIKRKTSRLGFGSNRRVVSRTTVPIERHPSTETPTEPKTARTAATKRTSPPRG